MQYTEIRRGVKLIAVNAESNVHDETLIFIAGKPGIGREASNDSNSAKIPILLLCYFS